MDLRPLVKAWLGLQQDKVYLEVVNCHPRTLIDIKFDQCQRVLDAIRFADCFRRKGVLLERELQPKIQSLDTCAT